ncbi:hypothetical protein QQ045_022691 [Rhodiola kirilowii]
MHSDPLVNFGLKLKRLRIHLRKWNWETFGDIRLKLRDMLLKVGVLEARLQRSWNSELANEVIVCKGFPPDRKSEIFRLTGFQEGNFPVPYLGVPLYRGRARIDMFSSLVNKVNDRIGGWMKKFLSMGDRVTLINSVLNSIGIHSMMVLPIPITILNRLTSLIANFLWDSGSSKRHHWKSWDDMCIPKHCGGLGIRNPKSVMLALHGKMAWSFLEQKTLWARCSKARFRMGERGSGVWNAFSHLIPAIRDNSVWILGRGDTTVDFYCWRVGAVPPDHLKGMTIMDILNQPELLGDLYSVLPAREAHLLAHYSPGLGKDQCLWTGNGSHGFSVR